VRLRTQQTPPGEKYASQYTYATELICTSVAMHWVMACHTNSMHPACSPQQMDAIMRHGLQRHRAVRAHCDTAARNGLLQIHEVLECCPLPARFVHRELHGCVGRDPDPEVREFCVALHELGRLLEHATDSKANGAATGVLFTARGHTTALFAGNHGLFHFDSAVAQVREIRASEVSAVLRIAHSIQTGNEYSITLVQPRQAWAQPA
jgi:hypothetical protein